MNDNFRQYIGKDRRLPCQSRDAEMIFPLNLLQQKAFAGNTADYWLFFAA